MRFRVPTIQEVVGNMGEPLDYDPEEPNVEQQAVSLRSDGPEGKRDVTAG